MVLRSFAKINLSLLINRKLKNGFHDIQSLFCLIDLKDRIIIKKIKNKKDKITFKGPHSKYVNKSNNTVRKILQIMRKYKIITHYYSIIIFKQIPVFAGLGGGTSNAATLFKFFAKKKSKSISFNKVVEKIGSDFRLFFYNYGFLKNMKTIISLQKHHRLYFLLAGPNIISSTKEVYSKVRKYSKKEKISQAKLKNKKNFIDYIKNSKNDLQSIVEKKHRKISILLNDIKTMRGCYFSRMSGSGSVCYGLFTNQSCSKAALISLRKKHPKFWFSIAKTI